jgi:hypothetical protein
LCYWLINKEIESIVLLVYSLILLCSGWLMEKPGYGVSPNFEMTMLDPPPSELKRFGVTGILQKGKASIKLVSGLHRMLSLKKLYGKDPKYNFAPLFLFKNGIDQQVFKEFIEQHLTNFHLRCLSTMQL